MPISDAHLKQASKNLQLLGVLYPGDYLFNDWAMTVSFYTAVHIIENAIFQTADIKFRAQKIRVLHSDELRLKLRDVGVDLPTNFTRHTERKMIVNQNFPEILAAYSGLQIQSEIARYKAYEFKDVEVDMAINFFLKPLVEWSNSKFASQLDINFLLEKNKE